MYQDERSFLLEGEIKRSSNPGWKTTCFKIVNAFTFVALFTVCSLTLTTSSGYLAGVLSTIEQRFQLNSTGSSLLFSIEDAVSFSTVLFVAHFGSTSNKPKIIFCIFFVVGIGTMLQMLPHFLYDSHSKEGEEGDPENGTSAQLMKRLFLDNSTISNCTSKDEVSSGTLWHQVRWIYFGQALIGVGVSAHPLAITYLDDSPRRNYLPIFIAIIYGVRSIGFSIGGLLCQQCLSVPASWPYITSDTLTNPNDPQFLGAWWIGFIPIAAMAFFPALLLLFFPRDMRLSTPAQNDTQSPLGTPRLGKKRSSEKANESRGKDQLKQLVKRILHAIKAWSRLPMVFIGYFFSAFIIMTGRLKPRGTIIMAAVCIAFASLLTPTKLLTGCENNMIAGITVPYDHTIKNKWCKNDRNLTATCNIDRHCPTAYNPVCAPSGMSYVSPCYAGCTYNTVTTIGSKNVSAYTHCSCYDDLFLNATYNEQFLIEGLCTTDCTWVYHFILIMLTSLLRNILYCPSLMSKVRFVDEQDRSMIQGLDKFIKNFLVTAPGPLVYGILFDKSCMLFKYSCGKTGNCLVYDIVWLRILLFVVATAFAIASASATFVTLYCVCFRMDEISMDDSDSPDVILHNHQRDRSMESHTAEAPPSIVTL